MEHRDVVNEMNNHIQTYWSPAKDTITECDDVDDLSSNSSTHDANAVEDCSNNCFNENHKEPLAMDHTTLKKRKHSIRTSGNNLCKGKRIETMLLVVVLLFVTGMSVFFIYHLLK